MSRLLLGVTGSLSEFGKMNLGKRLSDLSISPQFNGYSGVEIVIDEETSVFAGNNTGRILTINNPWGTQEQANNILAGIQGFQYQPYTASGALLTPAAELGDAVTVNGVYSGVYRMSRNHSAMMSADISAPQDEEINHEYPYEAKRNLEISREFRAVESKFAIQSNEISAKVSQTGGNDSSVGWSLTSEAWTVMANNTEVFRIDQSGATVTGVIRATSGDIGGFNIGPSSIYNGMESIDSASNGVYIGTNGISVGGGKFKVTSGGAVSATNMTLTGTLNIGGANITAAALRSGAQSAYSNSDYWSNGVTTANSALTTANTAKTKADTAQSTADSAIKYFSGQTTASNMLISKARISSLYIGGGYRSLSVKTITIDGTTYSLVGC